MLLLLHRCPATQQPFCTWTLPSLGGGSPVEVDLTQTDSESAFCTLLVLSFRCKLSLMSACWAMSIRLLSSLMPSFCCSTISHEPDVPSLFQSVTHVCSCCSYGGRPSHTPFLPATAVRYLSALSQHAGVYGLFRVLPQLCQPTSLNNAPTRRVKWALQCMSTAEIRAVRSHVCAE